ncbi:MAG: hypothetical protein ACOX2I_08650 [Candidatus Ozemobacteraceae bacterium]
MTTNAYRFKYNIILLVFLIIFAPVQTLLAIGIEKPEEIVVDGLVSLKNGGGAAWLRWNGHEILATEGYMIGTDLRVIRITYDAVVMYAPIRRRYFSFSPEVKLPTESKDNIILTTALPIWKLVSLTASAFQKDYLCSAQSISYNTLHHHSKSLGGMMSAIVSPNHRFHTYKGLILSSPVHIDGRGWEQFSKQIHNYNSLRLGKKYKAFNNKGSLVSNGRPLDQTIQDIALKTGVNIVWNKPSMIPLYCSLRDRPWHEILSMIVFFNNFKLIEHADFLEIK